MEKIDRVIMEFAPNSIVSIKNILAKNGFKLYIVGGALRDICIGRLNGHSMHIKDWDLATSAKTDDIRRLLNKTLRINVGGNIISRRCIVELLIPQLGTSMVSMGREGYEITPIVESEKGGVEYGILDDLLRRDFTINAMAYSFEDGLICKYEGYDGKDIDCMRDIMDGIIRSIGCPDESFKKNRFHMVRALYLANKLDFDIEENTLISLRDNISGVALINKGRMSAAFEKIIMGNITKGINYFGKSCFFEAMLSSWSSYDTEKLLMLISQYSNEWGNLSYLERLMLLALKFDDYTKLCSLYKELGVNKEIVGSILARCEIN